MEETPIEDMTPGCRANAIIAQWQADCLGVDRDSVVMAVDIAAAIREAEERGRLAGLRLQPRKPDAFGGVDFDGVAHGNLREDNHVPEIQEVL